MPPMRVATIVGTRPELIRLSRTIAALDSACDHCLIHTGQNYDHELSGIFFDDLGIRPPDHYLDAHGASAMETIANILIAVDRVLARQMPDAVLVLGDTNSCLSVLAAKRRQIPIFHMEAGNRCFDQRVPEETNRQIVDHIADINLTYSGIARDYLLRENLPPDRVIRIGSPMFEVLTHQRGSIDASDVLARLDLKPKGYFVVSLHREENVDPEPRFRALMEAINAMAQRHDLPVIFSAHPRTRLRLDRDGIALDPRVRLLKPLGFSDYCHLQLHSAAVLSDSGTITEEASILGFAALNLREAHERPEGMEQAAVMMTGLNQDRIAQCLDLLLADPQMARSQRVPDYAVPDVSQKVVRIIHSYTDLVNRRVWQKPGA